MRIVTGAISHETSTFTSVPTTWGSFGEHFGFLRGAQILARFRGTTVPTGGFIAGAETHGFELIPTIFAEPHPSGPAPRAVFEAVLGEMLDGIAGAGSVDGVLLELHGSMVAEGIDDIQHTGVRQPGLQESP
jgi:microcystin degradation protein MlrC